MTVALGGFLLCFRQGFFSLYSHSLTLSLQLKLEEVWNYCTASEGTEYDLFLNWRREDS